MRQLFAETAERHSLHLEWNETAPVEVACDYPAQPGLDFRLWLTLSGDEFVCGGEGWSAHIFPVDSDRNWQLTVAVVDGLVTGEARIVLYRWIGRSRPYWTVLQLRSDDGWTNVSTGLGCALIPVSRSTIVRNGYQDQVARLTVAWGSIIAWLLLIIGGYLLFLL
ncbi:MAG: hypothetical protein EPO38_04835 [Rhizorhabdus sp.]|jgi:hypothetical protein|nr:MAG: hypothetical protein EPO38_04835 [Rhizorhabdus sp.]